MLAVRPAWPPLEKCKPVAALLNISAWLQAADGIMNLWGCRITDDSALDRAKGRAVRPFLETADPWLTEARVVAAHGALHNAQVGLCPLPLLHTLQHAARLKCSAKHLHRNTQCHA